MKPSPEYLAMLREMEEHDLRRLSNHYVTDMKGHNMTHERFFNTQAESLTEAYHVLFDIKDRTNDDGIRYSAYQAVNAIKQTMYKLNIPVPERYDGDGRPA